MKKFFGLCVMFVLPFFATASDYEEGKHYTKITEIPVSSPEVKEYFSFYCPHCYQFEFMAKSIESNLPEGTSFVKSHVDFLRGASRKMQQMLSRALITAQEMDIAESQVDAIFKYIHVHRAVFTSQKDVRNVFILNGADGDKFDQLINSESVVKRAEKMRSDQDILAKSGDLKSVPSVVVNGKYLIDAHSFSDAHTANKEKFAKEFNGLVKYLLTLN